MSTMALEKLPESVETLAALIHEGKMVLLTEDGRVVATVAPKANAAVRRRKPNLRVAAFIETCLEPRPLRKGLNATAFLRAMRDEE